MLPFNPYTPNNGPPNAPQQQGTGNGNGNVNYSINGVPNFVPIQGQSQNQPPFNNSNNPNSNSLLGFAPGMPPYNNTNNPNFNALGGLPVGNMVAQNLLNGLLANGSMNALNPNAALVTAQLAWQNQLQSVNQLLSMALSNPSQLGCFNPMVAQGLIPPHNGAFPGNQQMGLLQPPNGFGQQVNRGQQNSFPPMVDGNASKQFSAPNQQMQQMSSLTPSSSGPSLPHNCQAMGSQVMQGNMDRTNLSTPNQRQNKNINRDRKGGASNWRDRYQNANQYPQKMNGKAKFSDQSRESGNIKVGGRENAQSSGNDSKGGNRRSLVMQYSEKEIQQWRDERKKYYPTKVNVQKQKQLHDGKKSADAEQEAELRRQQLKSILAKQAEMGFDVPEIPLHLADADTKALGSDQRKRPFQQNGRGRSRFNKRGGFDHNERFNATGPMDKKPFEKHARSASKQQSQLSTRKPTLLEKLLTEDIKRDGCSLLQAFRFMAMNSYFEDDSKPLKFPEIMVKETSSAVEAEPGVAGLLKIEEQNAIEDLSDGDTAKDEVEEGELTE